MTLRRLFGSFTRHGRDLLRNSQSEFTPTAVFLGLTIGCLICFTNLSLGLQSGWISMMSIQSALIGFLVSRMLPTPLTPQEIIVVQTTAVATGTMPLAAGFVGILPALTLLEEGRDDSPPIYLSWSGTIAWSFSVAFFGVFLSPPLRKQVIVDEQLPFPSGTATAHLISVLHETPLPESITTVRRRHGYQQVDDEETSGSIPRRLPPEGDPLVINEGFEDLARDQGWQSLLWSFAFSGALALAAYFFPVVFTIPLFSSYLAKTWLWYFTPSLSYVGQGMIMGFPTTVSMNLGMLVGWAILSPLSKLQGWAPGPVGDMASGARGWILWTSLGIMCADTLVSLSPVLFEFILDLLPGWTNQTDRISKEDDSETEDRLVSARTVIIGLVSSVVLGTILISVLFGQNGIKPFATFLGFILGGMLSVIGVRALGETDLNPVSGLGKISQLFFAWITPGNIVANIIAGGVAEAGAQQAGDLMQDLKTGHLLHASPRAQFYGQLIGSAASIVVTSTAYTFYQKAYTIPGPSFPAPTAYVWLSLARLLRDGQLPNHSAEFMGIFTLLFGVLSAAKTYTSSKGHWIALWIPSGVAFAIGFLNPPSFSIARLIGGTAEFIFRTRYANGNDDIRLIIVASGFVLGEGVVGILSLILRMFGVGVISCIGCGHGLCGGCPA